MLLGNSFGQTVHTHHASVHQAAKLVAALLRVARVTAGLAKSNGSLYRRVYDSRHLQADCQKSGSAPEPTVGNRVWATFTFLIYRTGTKLKKWEKRRKKLKMKIDFEVSVNSHGSQSRRSRRLRREEFVEKEGFIKPRVREWWMTHSTIRQNSQLSVCSLLSKAFCRSPRFSPWYPNCLITRCMLSGRKPPYQNNSG